MGSRFIVTPRLHGIQHSIVRQGTDSNGSSGLRFGLAARYLEAQVAQQEIAIGVPAYRDSDEVSYRKLISLCPSMSKGRLFGYPGRPSPARQVADQL
jgi:hypothetical protein